jgi:hypothetical protein
MSDRGELHRNRLYGLTMRSVIAVVVLRHRSSIVYLGFCDMQPKNVTCSSLKELSNSSLFVIHYALCESELERL